MRVHLSLLFDLPGEGDSPCWRLPSTGDRRAAALARPFVLLNLHFVYTHASSSCNLGNGGASQARGQNQKRTPALSP